MTKTPLPPSAADLLIRLLWSDEPWTRYRALVDLLGRPEADAEVRAARREMVRHPAVRALLDSAADWPGYALKRHSDARHPLHTLAVLADFGLRAGDPGLDRVIGAVLARQATEGAFQTLINVPRAAGGPGADAWAWMACDTPVLLYALLAFGLGDDPRVRRAVEHLSGLAGNQGWPCAASPELGRFRGPGRRADPCPLATVYALKALAQRQELREGPAARGGVELLLTHWEHQADYRLRLFGIGADFRKLKYPFVWYDLLHVADTLSAFPFVHEDPRYRALVREVAAQAGPDGQHTAGSAYLAWKGWSFADKKAPSPWLTFLALRVQKRSACER